MFNKIKAVQSIDLTTIRAPKTINMLSMFDSAGYNATTFEILGLSDWDTSKAQNMRNMFDGTGHYSNYWNIGNISDWDTSKVQNMQSK